MDCFHNQFPLWGISPLSSVISPVTVSPESLLWWLESQLGQEKMFISNSPNLLRKFTFAECDTDQQSFVTDIADTFDQLSPDYYEQSRTQIEFLKTIYPQHAARLQAILLRNNNSGKLIKQVQDLVDKLDFRNKERFYNIKINRFRSIAKFEITAHSNKDFQTERASVGAFTQNNLPSDDIRSMPRYFAEASNQIIDHPGFRNILQFVCQQITTIGEMSRFTVTFHQVCTYASPDHPFLLPDGIHQDGVDYIVSAIPIILDHVIAPLSTVYMPDMSPVLQTQLQVGEGLLHSDRNYWHGVSPVKSTYNIGRRASLGFDIEIIA